MTAPERKGLRRVWVSIYDSGAVGGIWHDAISQRPVAQIGHDFAEYTRSDLADAAVAAALERAILAATSLADGRDEAEFIEREIRRALATDEQTDALDAVKRDAERAERDRIRDAVDDLTPTKTSTAYQDGFAAACIQIRSQITLTELENTDD